MRTLLDRQYWHPNFLDQAEDGILCSICPALRRRRCAGRGPWKAHQGTGMCIVLPTSRDQR